MKDLQTLPPGLWMVATPIGNLQDFTPRAKAALESADLILCEDTRRTAKLLAALGMNEGMKRLRRMDAHTPERQIHHWVEDLQKGLNIAVVTDAGTPCVSDPGSALVAKAQAVGVRITPLPGVSAVTALLSVCGFVDAEFSFRGFFPRTSIEQKRELERAAEAGGPWVNLWFESPNRIEKTLEILSNLFPHVETVVGKELTKIHERIFYGTAAEVHAQIQQEMNTEGKLGEWVFAIKFSNEVKEKKTELDWKKTLKCMHAAGVSASQASQIVSQEFGISKKEVYEETLFIFDKKFK